MTTWYRINRWGRVFIEPIQVVKETPKMIRYVYQDSRGRECSHLCSKGSDHFPTWEEAHAEALRRADRDLKFARLALQKAQGHHGNVLGMKKPEVQS